MVRGRLGLRAMLSLVLVAGTIVVSASPCRACSCAPQTPAKLFRSADVALVGRVVGEPVMGETTTVQAIRVETLYKGAVGRTADLVADIGSEAANSCAVLFPSGERIAVLAQVRGDGRLSAQICSYLTVRQLEEVASEPIPVVSSPASPAAPPTGEVGTVAAPREPLPPWAVPILGALLAIGAITAVLWRAARRPERRRSTVVERLRDPRLR
jgi:hypothetical protein